VTVVIYVLHSVHLFIILFISNISMPQTRNQATAKKAKTIQETKKRSSPCSNRRFASKKSSIPRSNCSSNRVNVKIRSGLAMMRNLIQTTIPMSLMMLAILVAVLQ